MSKRKFDLLTGISTKYKKKFRWLNSCIYCGQSADTLDHVLPISKAVLFDINNLIFKNIFQGCSIVPCCRECNTLASNESFFSIQEKRKYIKTKLKQKYKKVLKTPDWSEEELDELSPSFRNQIETVLKNKLIIELRLAYPIFKK